MERLFFVGYLARQVMLEESEHKQTYYHNLQSKDMEKILGQSPKVRVIEPLRKAGVIEVNDTYSVGRFSMGYRLSADYRQEVAKGHFQMVPIKGRAQLNRFDRWRESREVTAAVRLLIKDSLYHLPEEDYPDDELETRTIALYQHVHASYYGGGQSVYQQAG